MASKPETNFVTGVHKHLPPGRRDPYWMKNNNIYTSGIWDCWYSGDAGDLWVEYKFLERVPVRAPFAPALSELQLDWGRQRYHEGRTMAVIVGCKAGGVIFENLDWEQDITKADFERRLMTRAELAAWIIRQTQQQPRMLKRA